MSETLAAAALLPWSPLELTGVALELPRACSPLGAASSGGARVPQTLPGAVGMAPGNPEVGQGGGSAAEGPHGRKNVVAPFILPIRKSNMAMSTMFSSRLPLL